jgi:hypothetical protein
MPSSSRVLVTHGRTFATLVAVVLLVQLLPVMISAAPQRTEGVWRDDVVFPSDMSEADALELARHDYAHVLAEAVQALFPGTQITFGPSTDDGFYYDVKAPDSREPFSMEHRLWHHSGGYRWLLAQGRPRFDADNRFIGFIENLFGKLAATENPLIAKLLLLPLPQRL